MLSAPWPRYRPAGDAALVVDLGSAIDPALNLRVHALGRQMDPSTLPGIVEIVPAYCSLLVHYEPRRLSYEAVRAWAEAAVSHLETAPTQPSRLVEVPTLYGGDYGPDLDFVAQSHGLSAADVVRLHSGAEYTVYMMGFLPGFPYLGGLPSELATPRLDAPRALVRAGSVGIAGEQTGIYPLDSPGGWRLIGYTPLCLFSPNQAPPTLLQPGDRVRFVAMPPERSAHGA
jgi:inhibitor of KinA